ncbi:rhodanese-like domain-containing protein [Aliarcobacter trophiarum]|uniref:rhodanese-like domain-containing protein n=1 Tax=Aliarcobacter trophiarum TaxID=708186 RepID=UPI00100BBFAA|nr:rhodanese-like domain-containing protein [Aliarcobacter trophiarum]RXI28401.1 sulfurtransferase [Aliarcobacter trophiarum]
MKKIFAVLSICFLFLSVNAQETDVLKEPTSEVKELIKKYKLQEVDFDYVKKVIGVGNRGSVESILIDARPQAKYQRGTIPSSLNINDTNFDEDYKQLKDIDKNKELIVFCGGFACAKSPIVADLLMKKGHKNVKVYSAGEPQWSKKSYLEIDTIVAKVYFENNSALFVDARPYAKFLQETIVGSISVPDTNFEKLVGRFPIDKNEKIVTFCAGYECEKSHIIASKLYALGYKNVVVYAGGVPEWKKAGLSTTFASKKVEDKEKEKKAEFSKNGLKLGSDEGTIDGEWLKELVLKDKVPSNIQIVNVLPSKDFAKGHIKGAINIEAEKLNSKELFDKLPKNKSIVFYCSAGSRSLEAWMKLKKDGIDVSEIFYFDAVIVCKNQECKIDVNEPLE